MSLKELRSQLCESSRNFCRICFVNTNFVNLQNPPNVFRINKLGEPLPVAFIFDKPNDNTLFRNSALVPITIFDDRAGAIPQLHRAASHSTLILLCRLLRLIPQNSNCLESSNFYVTNAVKCDVCSMTGKTGRVIVNDQQVFVCRERFLVKELQAVKARALVFFGVNAQRYSLGFITPLWEISNKLINGTNYWVMRVPHTSPSSFNTYGGKGQNYIAPFNELCRRANICVMSV